MLECPHCGERVDHQGRDHWFNCPSCGYWIRLRVSNSGSTWFQGGVMVNGEIRPMDENRGPVQAVRAQVRGLHPLPSASRLNIDQMDLQTVQAQRQQIVVRQRELESSIRRLIGLLSQNPQGEQLRQYSAELNRDTDEQNNLQRRDQRLAERESALQQEAAQARQSGSSGAGVVFVLGAILAAADIYVFTRMINLHLDPRAILIAILIALVSGLLTLFITIFD